MSSLVVPMWPEVGQAALHPITSFVSDELKDDLEDPKRCLLPMDQWPDVPPKSYVHASRDEWYSLVCAGARRGIFGQVKKVKIFKGKDGSLVLNGAMGVDKPRMVNAPQ